ncbi:MAG: HD domain-containing phosphohydrolase [Myxococcota bacterium]
MRTLTLFDPTADRKNTDEQRLKILYLDDEPHILKAFARAIRKTDLDLTCMSDPNEARALLTQESFDIIAVDYRMPGMTGIQFLELVQQDTVHSYKLMITALCEVEILQAAINRGGVHQYVTKPWRLDQLQQAIISAKRHACLVRQNAHLQRQLAQQNRELAAMNEALDRLVQTRTLNVLNALVSALDYRDTETQWHSRRVALFAHMIGSRLGLTGEQLHDVELGALLHDVGKIGISDSILLKPGKLTEEEWVEMRRHTLLGHELLRNIDFLDGARPIVLQHHERWDGNGYPNGLGGEAICIGARIFAVCDTLDAITSDRPYRKARPFSAAKQEIIRCSGTQFDERVVEAFLSIPDEHWLAVIEAGHAYEDAAPGFDLSLALDRARDVIPEITSAVAWQSANSALAS